MISIITASFNRGYILANLYKSLVKQSNMNFEWIIVDDGSTDNTQDLAAEWASHTESFEIRYVCQKNGGKHRAVNRGVAMAQYNYCFLVDSDDYLESNSIELIHAWILTIDLDPAFAGVAGLKGYIGNGQVGGYPQKQCYLEYIDATNLERRKYSLGGDKAEIYRTEILKKYPFPEFDGENFVTEEVAWDAIARDGYKLRWFNVIIYRCNYIDDGITRNIENIHINNFEGYTYATRQRMRLHGFLARESAAGGYLSLSRKKGLTLKETSEKLGIRISEIVFAYMMWHTKNCVKGLKNLISKSFKGNGGRP